MSPTLAPLSALLATVADSLEHRVAEHLDGQAFVDCMEAVEQLRRIVRVREAIADPSTFMQPSDVDVLEQLVPDYCALAACQNIAVDSDGPSRHKLCAVHSAQFDGWVAQVLRSGQVGT